MNIKVGCISLCCLSLLGIAALNGCGDGGRPRLNGPGVLHDNGGEGGSGGSMQPGQGGETAGGGTAGAEDDEDLDAGTGGYQIGTDWDGNTRPTADNAHGIDAAAGTDDRGNTLPPDAGNDGG